MRSHVLRRGVAFDQHLDFVSRNPVSIRERVIRPFIGALFLLFLAAGQIQGQFWTIPACSSPLGSNLYGPMNSIATANATNRTAIIYPSSELSGISGQTLTAIYFDRITTSGTMAGTPNFKVYMREEAATDWGAAALDWATAIAGAVLVFDGDPVCAVGSSAGWKMFPLSTNFVYTGANNLAIFYEYTNATASTAISWSYEYTSPCVNTGNSNTTKYSNNTTGTLPTSLSSTNYRRALIGFDLVSSCYPPTCISATNITTTTADISWMEPGTPPSDGYEWEVRTSGTPGSGPAGLVATGSTTAGVVMDNVTGLSPATIYSLYVRGYCGGVDYSPWSNAVNFGTPGPNDDCANATSLTVNPDLICTASTTGTTIGATQSAETPPSCGATGVNDDVWYSFVATSTSHIITLSNVTGNVTDMAMAIYSGSCGALTHIQCSDPNTMTVGGLTPSQTYYVRVWTITATIGSTASFTICVTTPPPPPPHDECSGAINLTVNPDLRCGSYVASSTISSTASSETAPTCNATGINDDVWFSFTATASALTVTLWGASVATAAQVYSGNCGSLTTVMCGATTSGGLTLNLTGLTVSAVYRIRVYSTVSTAGVFSDFNICVGVPIAPSNDNEGGAIPITIGNPEFISTVLATQSLVACTGTADDDVWYSFTPQADGAYNLTFAGISGLTDTGYEIFQGLPSMGTSVACHDGPEGGTSWDGFLAAYTYYIRVYSWASATGTRIIGGTITLGSQGSTPPTNNPCTGAMAISTSPNGACVYTAVTSIGATYSLPRVSCISSFNPPAHDDDIWLSFTTVEGGPHIIKTTFGGTYGVEVYTGTCDALTAEPSTCSTSFTGTTGFSVGLMPATSYLLRIWRTGTGGAAFDVCVERPPSCPTPTSLAASMITSMTAQANWNCTSCPGSYIIEYGPSASFTTPGTDNTPGLNGTIITAPMGATSVGISGLTANTQYRYFVRLDCTMGPGGYSANSAAQLFTTLPPPPSNDDAGTAISLTVGAACAGNIYSMSGGTFASGEPYPLCSGIGIGPVWFSFVAPASGAVRVTTDISPLGTFTDSKVAIFSATNAEDYSTFSVISCDDDGGITGSGFMSVVYATGLVPGTTYYIAVDRYQSSTTAGTFCIQVDALSSAMLSTTNTCASTYQTPVNNLNTTYMGWFPLLDASSKLVALLRNPAGGSVGAYSVAQYIHAGPVRDDGTGKFYLNRNFNINNSASATNVDVIFFFLDSEMTALQVADPGVTSLNDLNVTKTTNVTCTNDFMNNDPLLLTQNPGGNGVTGGVSWIQVTAPSFPSFSNFFIHGGAAPLPVQLVSFTGKAMKDYNHLQWTTATEINADKFEIERASAVDGEFEVIGAVAARNTNGESYGFEDYRPGLIGYYRLKMMDLDGQFTYSGIVSIKRSASVFSVLKVYPVPARDEVQVDLLSPEELQTELEISDISGRVVRKAVVHIIPGHQTLRVDLQGLDSGTYFVQLMGSTFKVIAY